MEISQLISRLLADHPSLKFTAGPQFCWSPETSEIFYKKGLRGKRAAWSLLHETGHALLDHRGYQADFELIRLEMAAWERAKELATKLAINIDEEHIQNCLDTYRDWINRRSVCPKCSTKSLQQPDFIHYRCFNCHAVWRVSANRFGRSYRRHAGVPQPAVFQELIY